MSQIQKPIIVDYSDGARVVTNISSDYTNSPISITRTSYYMDGTPMDDEKLAKSFPIYVKIGDEYYIDNNLLGGRPLNLKQFGAKIDGISDDTDALQRAINFYPVGKDGGIITPKGYANGGLICVPRGQMCIYRNIDCHRGLNLVGDGRESTQIISYSPTGVFRYRDSGRYIQDEINLRNFSIWQHESVTATSGAGIEILFGDVTVQSTQVSIENVIIEGTFKGILLSAAVWSTIKNVFTSKCVDNGQEIQFTDGVQSVSSTSVSYINCYSNQNGKNGFSITRGGYCSYIGCATDSNAEYGYYAEDGSAHSYFGCGAEDNGIANVYLKNCEGMSLNIDSIYGVSTGEKHGVILFNCKQTLFTGGRIASVTATGYGIFVTATGGKITTIGTDFSGNYNNKNCNVVANFLNVSGNKGLVGDNGRYAIGVIQQPDPASTFNIGGPSESGVDTGTKMNVSFTEPGISRNVASWTQAIVADVNKVFDLVISHFIPNSSKGASATVNRTAGSYIQEQTRGTTANVNLMIDAGEGTVPSGNWNMYSGSVRDSLFKGGFVFGNSNGVKIIFGDGTPEGIKPAKIGTIYLNNTGTGIKDSIFIKQAGVGNTGWRSLYDIYTSFATINRPTNVSIGFTGFDDTLGKPIWLKSKAPDVWVDATGGVV